MFVELDRQRRLIEAALVAVIGEADRSSAHHADGHRTVTAWCRALGRWSHSEASRRHQTARLAAADGRVADALAAGQLGVAQAHELGRAHANPRCGDQLGDVIPIMLDHAQRLDHRDFRAVIDRWIMLTDLDGAHRDADAAHDARHATIVDIGAGIELRASGGAVAGAQMRAVLERYVDAEFAADWADTVDKHGDDACAGLLPRSDRQRRFDALAAIFDTAATGVGHTLTHQTPANGDPAPADQPAPPDQPQPPVARAAAVTEPTVNIVVDLTTLHRLLTDTDTGTEVIDPVRSACETTNGDPLAPAELYAAMWWGRVRRIVVDGAGVVVDAGRRRRLFTGTARDAVLLQSRRCVWPGCPHPSGRCQTDHPDEWHVEGATDQHNAGPLCPHHNRWKHTHRYTLHRTPDGTWRVHRPDGTDITRPPPV